SRAKVAGLQIRRLASAGRTRVPDLLSNRNPVSGVLPSQAYDKSSTVTVPSNWEPFKSEVKICLSSTPLLQRRRFGWMQGVTQKKAEWKLRTLENLMTRNKTCF